MEAEAVIARVLRRRNKEGSKSIKGLKDGDVDATGGLLLDFLDPPDAILMDRYSNSCSNVCAADY